uniref:Adhesion G protein-coupled receptor E1 n=1 Tax=Gopherus evgoodei TaxID=1825980 RepID=A0A8C4YTM3_9SAUR
MQVQPGFLPLDLDECSRDPSLCGPSSICTNTLGSYTCTCPPGYLPHSQPGPWHIANLLGTIFLAWCPLQCQVLGPAFSPPLLPSREGSIVLAGPIAPSPITDMDECLDLASCPAHAICTNTPGSHYCTCNTGFASSSGDIMQVQPGFLPLDLDECSRDPSPCGPSSICTNTLGSYTCTCPPGYLPRSQAGIPFSCAGERPVRAALPKAAEGFASILDQTPSWSNLSTEQVSTMATVFLENVENVVLDVLKNPTGNGSQTIQMKQLDLQTKVIEDSCPRKDSVVSLEVKGETMKISCRTIQGTVAQEAANSSGFSLGILAARAGVAFASYVGMESILNGSFFHGQRATSDWPVRINSRVVSAFLTSQAKTDFPDPINYTFQTIMPSSSPDKLICVSWEATDRRGSWSRAGCRVVRSNASHTTCSCNRISNLAVLMASGEITAGFPLFLISHVGLALSLLCLFLAILTFLLCRSIRNVNTSIHLQLCLCLFLADLLFLTAVDSPSHQLACAIIAGLLHYLFLACFAWMFLEAVVLFLTVRNLGVVNYFSTHSPKMWHLSLFGYSFPALVVAVSATVMPEGYGRQENCWLSMEKGFIWSFLGPVCVIIGMNSVLFALTLWMLQRKLFSLNSEVSTLKNTRLLTFKAIAQVFILGCTWIFGLLQVGPAATVMAYLFTIVNSLQGAFIFLVHCLLNRQVPPRAVRPLIDSADPLPAESRAG